MNAQSMLESTLTEILNVINPTREDLETRLRIIDGLRTVIKNIEGFQDVTVEPFGSFLSHLFSRWGDLDISIELPNGLYILLPAKKHKQTLLEDVIKALRRTGSFRRLQFVSHARVPILKLESQVQSISCDISINNLSGYMKSKFLLWVSLIDHRFRDLVLLVKEWAKANGINNPKSGTFNSYSLTLLVIFHFQTCVPPILPPLEYLYPGNMAAELVGIRADVEKHIEEEAAKNITRFRNNRRINHNNLTVLFISFLGKFLDIGTRTMDQGICTYSGRWEYIDSNPRWLPRTYAIFIEDPFHQPENTARAVAQSKMNKVAEAFRNTYHMLIDPNQRRETLLPSLVRREISHLFPGLTFGTVRADFGQYPWLNQNAPPGNHLSSLSQHQSQMNRQVNQPLNLKRNGNQLSVGRQMRVNNQQKPVSQTRNMDRQKTGRQVHATNQQLPREIPQNVYRQKNAQQQNSEQLSLGGQGLTTNQPLPRNKTRNRDQNADRQKASQQVQNSMELSSGGQQWTRENPNPRRQRHKVDRRKNSQKMQNGNQLSLGRQRWETDQQSLRDKTRSQGQKTQNIDRQRKQQLQKEKPVGQGRNTDPQKTSKEGKKEVPPVDSQIVNPPWPHTLQPNSIKNVV